MITVWGSMAGAWAAPSYTVEKKFYNIDGKTGRELRKLINRKYIAFEGSINKNSSAFLQHEVRWSYKIKKLRNGCQLIEPKVEGEITYVLPRFVGYASADEGLKKRWDAFFYQLEKHEDVHKKYAVAKFHELESALLKMGKSGSCWMLKHQAKKVAQKVINKYNRLNSRFDRRETKANKWSGGLYKTLDPTMFTRQEKYMIEEKRAYNRCRSQKPVLIIKKNGVTKRKRMVASCRN